MKVKLKKIVLPKTIVYDPYRIGVTQSLIGTWMNCREAARNHLNRIRPKKPNESFLFGSYVHHLHEYFIKDIETATNFSSREVVQKWVQTYLMKFRTSYKEIKEFKAEEIERNLTTASILFENYILHYSKDYKKKHWVDAEHTFEASFDIGVKKPIILRGQMDGIFEQDGLWILETKTKSRMNEDTLMDMLSQDFQSFFYLTALKAITGKTPKGVLYNILRKPGLRQGKKETKENFRNRLIETISKESDHYFVQYEIRVAESHIRDFENKLKVILREFVRWWENGDAYHFNNLEYCENKYGACPFLALCSQGNQNMYKILDHYFTELGGVK